MINLMSIYNFLLVHKQFRNMFQVDSIYYTQKYIMKTRCYLKIIP